MVASLKSIRVKMTYIIAWLVIASSSVLLLSQINWVLYRRLVRYGVRVEGTVIQVLPKMHATVNYRYDVHGHSYEGQTQPMPPNPPIENLESGAKLIVYYDPKNPERSVLGSPRMLFKNETISIVICTIIISTAVIFAWRQFGFLMKWRK